MDKGGHKSSFLMSINIHKTPMRFSEWRKIVEQRKKRKLPPRYTSVEFGTDRHYPDALV